jgi:hypothetical protein
MYCVFFGSATSLAHFGFKDFDVFRYVSPWAVQRKPARDPLLIRHKVLLAGSRFHKLRSNPTSAQVMAGGVWASFSCIQWQVPRGACPMTWAVEVLVCLGSLAGGWVPRDCMPFECESRGACLPQGRCSALAKNHNGLVVLAIPLPVEAKHSNISGRVFVVVLSLSGPSMVSVLVFLEVYIGLCVNTRAAGTSKIRKHACSKQGRQHIPQLHLSVAPS